MKVVDCDVVINISGRVQAQTVEEAKEIVEKRINKIFNSDAFEYDLMGRLNKEDEDDMGFFYTIQNTKIEEK